MPRLEGESVCVLHLTPERRVAAIAERCRGKNDRAPSRAQLKCRAFLRIGNEPLSLPKIRSAWIRSMSQNHRIIRAVCAEILIRFI